MKAKILFTDKRPMSEESMKLLHNVGEIVWVEDGREFMREVKDASVIISPFRPITREVLSAAHKLKGIVVYGVGVDHVDLEAATERGIYVAHTPSVNYKSVAELAFGLMLAIARNLIHKDASVRAGKWIRWEALGTELWHKTLGVIGLGAIGRYIVILGKCLGMQIICYTKHPSEARARKHGVKFVDLDTLLTLSDFVVICCILTEETHGLIGEREIGLMKPTASLVNVARGAVVDEAALIKALSERYIAGAALDVFENEPPNLNNPLLKMDNTIVLPHIGGLTKEASERLQMTVAKEAVRILRGEAPKHIANKEIITTRE